MSYRDARDHLGGLWYTSALWYDNGYQPPLLQLFLTRGPGPGSDSWLNSGTSPCSAEMHPELAG